MERGAACPQVWALLALAVLWAALDHRLRREPTAAGTASLTLAAALQQLFDGAAGRGTRPMPAFVGPWALALWGSIAVTAAYAAQALASGGGPGGQPGSSARDSGSSPARMALFGVTGELRRYFELQSHQRRDGRAGLGAGGERLVAALRRRAGDARLPAVAASRRASPGSAVAGLAVVKVIFFDLSSLDALYRVGSVFLLALVALSLAYLYYRHDAPRSERGPT